LNPCYTEFSGSKNYIRNWEGAKGKKPESGVILRICDLVYNCFKAKTAVSNATTEQGFDWVAMKIDKPKIRAILFDFVGVLLFPRSNYVPDKVLDAIDEMIGQVVDDNQFMMAVEASYHLNDEQFWKTLACIVDKYETYPRVWDLLPDLRKTYKLGIINNGTWFTFPYFDAKLKINERFDAFISSGVERIRKPEKRIYLHACQRLGVEPRECLFMDDSIENIQAAQQVGMQTIYWGNREDGYQQLIAFLKSRDLVWDPESAK
jgi:HAD superfamily hydrolase (TIGR01549 family)